MFYFTFLAFFIYLQYRATYPYYIMANNNIKLHSANKNKKDEFYTQISDIENELRHYKQHFQGKTVLCNCDDPRVSNFFKYFALKFKELGLKRLIATCYKNQDIDLFSQNECEQAVYIIYDGSPKIDHIPDSDEIEVKPLKGDGDFRSQECIDLLKQADIVCTNPPFSLFREYVAQLIEYNKKFLIIGHQNAIGYRECFKLLKDNRMWLGYGFKGGAAHFISRYTDEAVAGNHIEGMIRVSGVVWFTNLEIDKRHENLILYKQYNPDEYPKYENFDAINVDKTSEIPTDYQGVMGVPLTFMDKYNPEQFEIIGLGIATSGLECGVKPYKPEHKRYRKEIQKRGAVDGDLYMIDKEGVVVVPYTRILIRRK